jgi:2',3'-cyclic-nucleotide 2'-phosphodiesterase (5'-nucleotidase family)
LDLGDFMSTDGTVGEYRNEFIWSVMENLGTMAATFGGRELGRWAEMQEYVARGTIPFVATNLKVVEEGVTKPLAHPYLIREVGGVKVGLLGVMGGSQFTKAELPEDLDIVFEDPRDAIEAVLPEVRRQAEVVVLMANMDGRSTELLAEDVEGIDVALAGHRARSDKTCRRVGNAVYNESGIRGQWAGVVRLIVSTRGDILDWGGRNVSLDASVNLDPEVDKLVDQHEKDVTRMRRAGAAARKSNLEGKFEAARFLGVESCQSCHVSEYKQWLQTAHAHSYETLVKEGKEKDKECISCHVTGYGQKTGFSTSRPEPDLQNVQCESCHGIGSEHARGPEAPEVTETLCVTCHDTKNSPNFDYERYVKAVVHQ